MSNPLDYLGVSQATTTVAGKVELATTAETTAGTSTTLVCTPAGVAAVAIAGSPDASTTQKGVIEIATDAEAVAQTATDKALVPSNINNILAEPGTIGGTTAGAGNFTTLATSGAVTMTGGVLNLGSDNAANAVNLGVGTTARAIGIGDSAAAHVVTIGSTTGAAQLDLQCGTGNFSLDGAATSTYDIAASATSGTVTIGGTAQTGDLDIGVSSGIMNLNLGSGTGATTVNLGSGATGANTINIGTGAIGNVLTVGSVTAASQLDLLCGTGNFTLEGNVASTYSISETGVNTGTVSIGGGTGARTVNLAVGGTGAKTVNIATAAIGNIVTIGSVTAAASLDLKCGTGNFTLEGATASTYEISSTGVNTGTCKFASGTGARTVEIAGGGTGVKTVNIAAAATADVVTIGDSTGAGSLDLACGTGNFTLEGATASTYEISSTGVNTGTCKFASGTGARTVEIAGGGTGIKTINIGAAATADVITIGSTTAAGATTISAGTTGLTLDAAGAVDMVPATQSAAATSLTLSALVGSATFTGQTTASGAQETFTITNTLVAADSAMFVTVTNVGSNDARMTMEQVKMAAGSFEVMTQNNGAAALNGNVIINFWVFAA